MAIQATPSMDRILECPVKRTMVCVDGSEDALFAFRYYLDHVHEPENEVVIFHASDQVKIPPFTPGGGVGFMPDMMQAAFDDIARDNARLKEKYEALCNELHVKHVIIIENNSLKSPGATIVDASKEHTVNLIVLGCRGLGKIRRTILGSVSDYVIHHSHVSVLICPPVKK